MTKQEVLLTLFVAHKEEQNKDRFKAYLFFLRDIPDDVLEKAVFKVVNEWPHSSLPSAGYILQACKSLYQTVNPDERLADWPEALAEIERAMYNTPWGHTPQFSRPEITATVKAFGWKNLHEALAEAMPTIRAQLKRIYEDVCSRTKEDSANSYILGLGGNPLSERNGQIAERSDISKNQPSLAAAAVLELAENKTIFKPVFEKTQIPKRNN